MRKLVLIVIVWGFAFQSLALGMSPACDPGADSHAEHAMMMGSAEHVASDMPDNDHHNMPCCEESGDNTSAELCQLTCAVGGCGAAAPLAQEWLSTGPAAAALFQSISPSSLAASQRNLLRPPISA